MLDEGAEPAAVTAAVRETLRAALPSYMVPAAFTTLAAMPLTANGKLDRALLTERAGEVLPTAGTSAASSDTASTSGDSLAEVVTGVWCEVLGLPAIDPDDDFFDIGGDSFKVVRAVRKLEALLGAEVPMDLAFDEPTVAGFTAALAGHGVEVAAR
ncbi:phosphopantetheine-binding protein [Kitasatospora sp. Ki12]